MKITFILRSKSDSATIYLRARTETKDYKIKTNFSINSDYWEKGDVKFHKIGRSVNKHSHKLRKENVKLREIRSNLEDLKDRIINKYVEQRPILSSQLVKASNPAIC